MSRPPPSLRAAYPAFYPVTTRWMDNDAYGHANNVVYYSWFDTAVNRFLIDAGTLDIAASPTVGMVVETGCRYHRSIKYPERVTIGLRVAHLGTSSVRYEVAAFREDEPAAAAEGHFVHVYVDRATQRPVPIPAPARAAMRRLQAAPPPPTDATGTPMDLEAEYNNRAKVPDHATIRAGWTRDAEAFRASHPHCELGLSYGPTERQALDLFWPGTARDVPMAIFVHGGYWQGLDRSIFSHFARGLLAHGVAVAMPSYDLCPQVSLAVLVEQVRDAAAFLARLRGGRMLATGHSAGGHLAAMLLATDWFARGLPADTVHSALPISGLFDLPPLTHTSVNTALRLDEAEARRLSPLFLPRPAGRIHAVVGDTEGVEYFRQSRSIAEAWGGTWQAIEGLNHFTVVEPLGDSQSSVVTYARSLLSSE